MRAAGTAGEKTHGEVLAEAFSGDSQLHRDWERLALARFVAAEVVRYRSDHGLTQTEFGRLVEMSQPQVARLELAEHNPSIETLSRVVSALGVELTLSLVPGDEETLSRNVTKRARESAQVAKLSPAASLLMASGPAARTRGRSTLGGES